MRIILPGKYQIILFSPRVVYLATVEILHSVFSQEEVDLVSNIMGAHKLRIYNTNRICHT